MQSWSPVLVGVLGFALFGACAAEAMETGPDGERADSITEGVGDACSVGGIDGVCELTANCTGDNMSSPGHCQGPSNVQCCTPTGSDGPNPNEGLAEVPGVDGCPDGMLRTASGFCVDQFEASLIRASDGSPWSPYQNPGSTAVRAVSIAGAVPQAYISQRQAADACEEAGKRLCSNIEFVSACQGASEHTYPYGDTREWGRCNDRRSTHPAAEFFGTTADWIYSMLQHPGINQIPDSLDRTGDNAGCETEDGAMDMMGNLHEWTSDPAGTFRGGYYVDTWRNGEGCSYRTTAHDASYWDYSTGFRCCAD